MEDLIATIRGSLYRLRCQLFRSNVHIKKGLKLYRKLEIKGKGLCIIGKNCTIRGIPGSRNQYVTLYSNSPEAAITIGDNAELLAAKVSCKFAISIGHDVLIEEASLLDTDFHSVEKSRKDIEGESRESCMIVIGDRVSIGARSIIAKGSRIGDESIVGPNSVVRGPYPPGSLIMGNPAKQIRMGSKNAKMGKNGVSKNCVRHN